MPEPKLFEYEDGTKSWWLNGKLYRLNGPAVEWCNGNKEWWLNDKLHREDGPALEYPNGTKFWYLHGKQYTEEEYIMIQFMNGKNIYA